MVLLLYKRFTMFPHVFWTVYTRFATFCWAKRAWRLGSTKNVWSLSNRSPCPWRSRRPGAPSPSVGSVRSTSSFGRVAGTTRRCCVYLTSAHDWITNFRQQDSYRISWRMFAPWRGVRGVDPRRCCCGRSAELRPSFRRGVGRPEADGAERARGRPQGRCSDTSRRRALRRGVCSVEGQVAESHLRLSRFAEATRFSTHSYIQHGSLRTGVPKKNGRACGTANTAIN